MTWTPLQAAPGTDQADHLAGAAPASELPASTRAWPDHAPSTRAAAGRPAADRVDVDVVVPVHNEERDLAAGVERLQRFLATFPFRVRTTIADNASTDRTWAIAQELAGRLPGVTAVRLDAKGRGLALRTVWSRSDAAVVAYMDVDLSTDLRALLPLVAPLVSGHSDVAIGNRLARSSRVVRGAKREVISRSYNLLLHATLRSRFADAQCGFKAIRSDAARELLPLVQDTGWFFDTELLVLAERVGLRIHEVPVDWVDDPDSRVDLVATAGEDLRGILRLGRALAGGSLPLARLRDSLGRRPLPSVAGVSPTLPGQLARFAVVGVASTVAYIALYLLLRASLGAQGANLAALLLTALANTAANRRWTFGVRGRARVVRHQAEGLAVFALGLVLTGGSLALVAALAPNPSRATEVAALVAANLTATVVRFLLLRGWVFHPRRSRRGRPAQPSPDPAKPTQPAETPIALTPEESL